MSSNAQKPEPLQSPPKGPSGHVPWLLSRIWTRINRQNEHFMGVIVGQEGSGKSYTALKIAREIDPTFTAGRVIFDITDLLRVLKDGDHQPGQFYVLDEAGVQLGNRTWQDRGQILANQALQLIRSHNLGLLFTLPRLGELDSQAQGRLQAFMEMTDKKDGEYVAGKWKWMDPDRADQTGEIYKKFPRRRRGKTEVRVTSVSFTPPSDDIVEPYEETKAEFQEEFYEETIEALEDAEEDSDADDGMSVKEVATEIASDGISQFINRHGQTQQPYINKELIRAEYELPHSDARAVKSLLEKQFGKEDLNEIA